MGKKEKKGRPYERTRKSRKAGKYRYGGQRKKKKKNLTRRSGDLDISQEKKN